MSTECTVTLIQKQGPLVGEHIRLEPLGHQHVPGLVAAGSEDPSLYRWTVVPSETEGMHRYVDKALAARDDGLAAPFAVVRTKDETVIGCSRLWDLAYWDWPADRRTEGPDACEIGHTWLAASAIRTGANTEMKRLMLTLAFEGWRVHRVCFHTDARNERSYAALERIGARFEGVLRAHRIAADQSVRNSARFSITASEWPDVRRRLDERFVRHLR